MRAILGDFTPRQRALAVIATAVVGSVVTLQCVVFPTYDRWQALKARVRGQQMEFAHLRRNVTIGPSVEQAWRQLGPQVHQTATDEVTFSRFLQEVEAAARRQVSAASYGGGASPGVTIVNAKPQPVEDGGTQRIYRLRLTVAGKLMEIVRFVSELVEGESIVGIEAFDLRGVQGASVVECGLSVRMVRLIDLERRKAPSAITESAAVSALRPGGEEAYP
ncbi:MAG TPA: hypothetical protein VM389_11075 [Phycisphaerae bacterium]|nr:hypothetical protein [Phycisphaerae bacterium]HUU23064.1 hypothetical protein [Phycisphaerae bacterium]